MIVRFPLELLLAFTLIFLCRLAWFLYRQAHFPADRTLEEVIPFLRPVYREEVEELTDPAGEEMLRLNLGERQFAKEQKRRMGRLLEQVQRMAHNAGFLREWARRERRTAWSLGDEQRKTASDRLVAACIEVRGGACAIQVALHVWRTKAAIYPPARALWLSSLRKIVSFDVVFSYERMAEAAMELGLSAAENFQQALEQRL